MKLARIAYAVATLTLGMASFGAQAVIVNIDARSHVGTNLLLGSGSYVLSWAGIAGGGLYDAWQYNNATSGNFRDAFSVTVGEQTFTFDRNDGNFAFNNYATAASALTDFQSASGKGAFAVYGADTDMFGATGALAAPFTFTLHAPALLNFTVPDYVFWDNKGGVSLSITAAVPEPETYALMLGGLGALAFVARRRRSNAL